MKKFIDFWRNTTRWKNILWVVIGLFLLFAFLAIKQTSEALKINSIEVAIDQTVDLSFIDSNKVLDIVREVVKTPIIGSSKKQFNLALVERRLEAYPFIDKADVVIDFSGKLLIKIIQREPILRIINAQGMSYYVANNGYKMPLHFDFTPRVMVATGNITETLVDSAFVKSPMLKDLLLIANYCSANEFWRAQIEQLFVDNYNDILLIPKVGNHSIVFGSAEHLDSKFARLLTFYKKGLNAVGWQKYQQINLKFEGQIVAEKQKYIFTPKTDSTSITQ
jgi:cell division protein FtsQ